MLYTACCSDRQWSDKRVLIIKRDGIGTNIGSGIRSFPGWLLSPDGFFPERRFPGKTICEW